MKKLTIFAAIAAAVVGLSYAPIVAADPSNVLDSVDIGDTTSEAAHNLLGWSNVWSSCGWCDGGDMRLIWGDGGESSAPANNWASVTLDAGFAWAEKLRMRHLDGAADDGFNVYVNGVLVDTYVDQYPSNTWVTTVSDISSWGYFGQLTIKLEATASAWSGIGTWGQVAFNKIQLWGEPWLTWVNIGSPDSEGDDLIGSWGPIQPDTTGGNWGGMGSGTCGVDHDGVTPTGTMCDSKTRVIWEPDIDDGSDVGSRAAKVLLLNLGKDGTTLIVRYLDGLADDSFSIQVRGENSQGKANTKWYTLGVAVSGETDGIEDWHVMTFDLTTDFRGQPINLGDIITIKFRATGPAWPGKSTWGQVAIDWVALAS